MEKIANPLLEAAQSSVRTVAGVARRIIGGGDYPGLSELLGEFYGAVASGAPSPLAPDHLRRVTDFYEQLAESVRGAAERSAITRPAAPAPSPAAPLAVLTGARGFFGKAIARQLTNLGYRVRGIGRASDTEDPNVHEWQRMDLSREVPPAAFAGAAVVVHAAAESAGGYEDHQRNSINATHEVLRGMRAAGPAALS